MSALPSEPLMGKIPLSVLSELNRRHNYGLDLFLLSVDEGITGYRDDSLETVKRNEIQYGLPPKIVSYKDLFGWTMDEIVKMIGLKNNCTFCGVSSSEILYACILDITSAFICFDNVKAVWLVTPHKLMLLII
ncbi:hypothetical protein PRUPE_3G237200 [Prunus persica]|uniref:Uncharacterized protein n=1 Tax=Prunus persica TaxID=3760 RepID=A0A251Q4J8_PRUPE|nr:hypothetical protein PRUPE_3G237200 [Prunus persica]